MLKFAYFLERKYEIFFICNVKPNIGVLSSLKIRGRRPAIFRLDKTRVLNSFKNDPLLVVFAFSFNC